jgi:hypothetical protein
MTITEFLLARIAEDEADASGPLDDEEVIWARRLLAECEAKRRIVTAESWVRAKGDAPAHRRMSFDGQTTIDLPRPGGGSTELCGDAAQEFIDQWYEPSPPSRVLCILASIYADHPDHDEAWRP